MSDIQETFVVGIYAGEVQFQIESFRRATEAFDKAKSIGDTEGRFIALHHAMGHAAAISRILFPEKLNSVGEKRREFLRKKLGIEPTSPLKARTLRNHMEHFEQRLDTWAADLRPNKSFVNRVCMPRETLVGVDDRDILRMYDPSTLDYVFRGDRFNIPVVVNAVDELSTKVEAFIRENNVLLKQLVQQDQAVS